MISVIPESPGRRQRIRSAKVCPLSLSQKNWTEVKTPTRSRGSNSMFECRKGLRSNPPGNRYAIRKLLQRTGWIEPTAQRQLFSPTEAAGANPKLSAFCVSSESASPITRDADPADRRGDRLLVYLGLVEDAPPLFGSAEDLSRAGVLLAVPALLATGIFGCAQKIYGNLSTTTILHCPARRLPSRGYSPSAEP